MFANNSNGFKTRKVMTDNFNLYREFITDVYGGLPDTNEKGNLDRYFVVELMRRGKDNPDMSAANYHFKNYYIYSWRDLLRYEEEIKNICRLLRLRAYASVNYKLMSQVSLDTLSESARRIAAHDYKKFYNIFESCSGKYVDKGNSVWVIDIDKEDLDKTNVIKSFVDECEPLNKEKILFEMPTKSGLHIISKSFNLQDFNKKCLNFHGIGKVLDVKKNHLTLLYENL